MAQRTITPQTPEEEITDAETIPGCCHHWVILPADGPVSNGSCQVCGETREFKNYVESATWGDSRTTGKGSSGSATTESTSDDQDASGPDTANDDSGPEMEADSSDTESDG